jgi:hypothetical protein
MNIDNVHDIVPKIRKKQIQNEKNMNCSQFYLNLKHGNNNKNVT